LTIINFKREKSNICIFGQTNMFEKDPLIEGLRESTTTLVPLRNKYLAKVYV